MLSYKGIEIISWKKQALKHAPIQIKYHTYVHVLQASHELQFRIEMLHREVVILSVMKGLGISVMISFFFEIFIFENYLFLKQK